MGMTDPPLSPDHLSRARLRLRKTVPMRGVGSHLRRRAGQSLEFRDYRDYQLGDDIRRVDWRASARKSPARDWVLKLFEAEEQLNLMILVDDRAAMRLPDRAEKLLFALWALRALALVAGEAGDSIVLARMFTSNSRIVSVSGRACASAAEAFAEDLWSSSAASLDATPVFEPNRLRRHLFPASVVVVLSDLLFADEDGSIGAFLKDAQKSWRQVIIQPFDTIDAELASLTTTGGIKVSDTEGRSFGDAVFTPDAQLVRDLRMRLDALRAAHENRWRGPGILYELPFVWPLSPDRTTLANHFRATFLTSGLFRAVSARGGVV